MGDGGESAGRAGRFLNPCCLWHRQEVKLHAAGPSFLGCWGPVTVGEGNSPLLASERKAKGLWARAGSLCSPVISPASV